MNLFYNVSPLSSQNKKTAGSYVQENQMQRIAEDCRGSQVNSALTEFNTVFTVSRIISSNFKGSNLTLLRLVCGNSKSLSNFQCVININRICPGLQDIWEMKLYAWSQLPFMDKGQHTKK